MSLSAAQEVAGAPAPICPWCAASGEPVFNDMGDHLFGVPGRWTLRRCNACDLVWVDPRPREEDFADIYPQRYLTHDRGAEGRSRILPRHVIDLMLRGWFGYGRRSAAGWALGAIPWLRDFAAGEVAGIAGCPNGRLLDVGCGNGVFLQRMAALGWQVNGIEPDPEAARVARAALGDVVHAGSVGSAPFPSGAFDVIVLKHVIEHLPDPVATLQHCRRLLKPGGTLVVVTPNTRSLGAILFGRDWLGWDVPRHVFLFSPVAIRRVLERAGFRGVHVETPTRKAARMWRMRQAIRRGRGNGTVVGLGGGPAGPGAFLFWLLECTVTMIRPSGEELRATAEK